MNAPQPAFMHAVRQRRSRSAAFLALLGFVILLAACRTASPYDARAYELATSLKVDALALMDRAAAPASKHRKAIDAIERQLDRAQEFARGLPHNDEAAQQWAILRDPDGHSLGGFLARWRRDGQLDPAFIAEARRLVAAGFDQLISLEGGKPRDPR